MERIHEKIGRMAVVRRRIRMLSDEVEDLAPRHVREATGSQDVIRIWCDPVNKFQDAYDSIVELEDFLASATDNEWPE